MKVKSLVIFSVIALSCLAFYSTVFADEPSHTTVALSSVTGADAPLGVVVDENGAIYFTSENSHNIYVNTQGNTKLFAGFDVAGSDGEPLAGLHDDSLEKALFHRPAGMDIDSAGNIYIADARNNAIRLIKTNGQVVTVAGDGYSELKDGDVADAHFFRPMDVAVAEDGTIYVADTLNHVIRKIADGKVTTLTKDPDRLVEVGDETVVIAGDYRDGVISQAMFNEPTSLVLDNEGNLYVADSGNQVIRYIDFEKNEVTTVAGNANASLYHDKRLYLAGGYQDGGLSQAKFDTPMGMAMTESGNLVVVDAGNSLIRYIHLAAQSVETLPVDGLVHPSDIAITTTGDLVVTDTLGNDVVKIVLWEKPAGFGNYPTVEKVYDDDHNISTYAREDVYRIQRLGIMVGSNGMFSPGQEITRAQFATVIVKALNLNLVPSEEFFKDVDSSSWYAPYVNTARANGIVNGYGDGTYGPNDPITREQIAIIVANAKNWTSSSNKQIFNDQNEIWPGALPAVHALYENQIMVGDGKGYFRPKENVSREMAAVVIWNMVHGDR